MDTTFPDTSPNPVSAADPQSAPVSPIVSPPDPEVLGREAAEVLATMLPMLNFQVTMKTVVEKDVIRIQMECEEAARLIGRRGATINELQFLLNRILQRRHKLAPRIFLDVDGPPESEKENGKGSPVQAAPESLPSPAAPVLQIPSPIPTSPAVRVPEPPKPDLPPLLVRAESVASQVRRWGDPMELGAMNAEDRRAVQEYFQKDRELEVIVLEGRAPSDLLKMRIQLKQK